MDDMVDLRSDTVTRPSLAMRRAMAEAEVGDDLYGEDPTVRRLEEVYAARVGKEAALFTPSGIMANQLAIKVLSRPGTLVVAGRDSHVVAHEDAGAAIHSGVQLQPVGDDDGLPSIEETRAAVDGRHHHRSAVSAICVENTHMPSGGTPADPEGVDALCRLGPPVHLDGARLFNAEVATGVPAARFAAEVTTVMSCLSKGLGAPVGSVLAGPADLIAEARAHRRILGGAMRQVGVLAAAGLVALETGIDRLVDDHRRARQIADAVARRWPGALDPERVRTNIVVFRHPKPDLLLAHLEAEGVRAGTIAPETVRLVTHLDVDDAGIERAAAALASSPE